MPGQDIPPKRPQEVPPERPDEAMPPIPPEREVPPERPEERPPSQPPEEVPPEKLKKITCQTIKASYAHFIPHSYPQCFESVTLI